MPRNCNLVSSSICRCPGPLSHFKSSRYPGLSRVLGYRGNMEFVTYCGNSQSSIPPFVFSPKVQSHDISVLVPNFPITRGQYRNTSARTLSLSSVVAFVCYWKWGERASPAALLPITNVAVRLSLLVLLPVYGKRGSWRVTSGRPPLLPLLPSTDRHVSSKLIIK